jgi:hypothetical protein
VSYEEWKENMISEIAYNVYQHRVQKGLPGDAKSDYAKAIEEFERVFV